MNVLVTGATGFIGGKLVDKLKGEGHSVRVLVRPGREGRFRPSNGIEVHPGDLGEPESLNEATRGIHVVVHSAGALGKWDVPVQEMARINVTGTRHLMRASLDQGVSHFVHLSAGGVSGPMPPTPADETVVCHPKTPYERTKLEGENAVLEFHRREKLPVTVLRPTFTYGPGDLHKLPIFRAVWSGRLALIGNGESLIHPVYVDDLLQGIGRAMEKEGQGEIYLIGGPRPVTKRELLDTIASSLDVRRNWWKIPRHLAFFLALAAEGAGKIVKKTPPLTRGRVLMMGWSFGYRIDKAKEKLDYSPQTDLAQGIAQTAAWYRENGHLPRN